VRMNPLISPVFSRTQFERCRPRCGGEGVALLLGTPGGTEKNGEARQRRPEQE